MLNELSGEPDGALKLSYLKCLLVYHSTFGTLEQSAAIAESLLSLATEMDAAAAAEVRRMAGVGFWRFGDTTRAIASLESAFADAAKAGLAGMQLKVGIGLIGLYYSLGDRPKAQTWLKQIEGVARGVERFEDSAAYACAQTTMAFMRGDVTAASDWFVRATKATVTTPLGRMGRWHRVFQLRLMYLRGEALDVEATVRDLIAHHRPALEVGEVSDSEVGLAIEVLSQDGQRERAMEVLRTYLRDYRRARQPLDYDIWTALGSERIDISALLGRDRPFALGS
jgi:hypothetical protein